MAAISGTRREGEEGAEGLRSRSRRRQTLPAPRLTAPQEQTLLDLRRQRKLGPKRIQAELGRLHDLRLSTSTVWHVLHRHKLSAALRPRRRGTKRYSCPVPGDRVQIDSCMIRKGLYHFTAVDDCTRMRVLGLYPDRTQKSAVLFLTQKVLPEFSFPLQRVQRVIIRPTAAPSSSGRSSRRRSASRRSSSGRSRHAHLNGKMERSQQTDRIEFWATVDCSRPSEALTPDVAAWQCHYNAERSHSSLGGKTPQQRLEEVADTIPTPEEVHGRYNLQNEMWQTNWKYTWAFVEGKGVVLTKASE